MQLDVPAAGSAALTNFRHLSGVLAVCDTGSIAQAAQRLQRTGAAVSRSVHKVELALGVSLFRRLPNRMVCNAFGHAARARIARAMRAFAHGLDALHGGVAAPDDQTLHVPCTIFHAERLAIMIRLAASGHIPTVMDELGVTRAVVTRAVNFLERSLGLPLFTRSADAMAPTAAARRFAACAQEALSELAQLAPDIAALRAQAAAPVVQNECFRPAITPFCALPTPTLPPADSAIAAMPWLSIRPVAA